jgi:hypothetical protein
MAYYYGTTSVAEAVSLIVKCAIELIPEKMEDGNVYIRIENDGSYTVCKPSEKGERK